MLENLAAALARAHGALGLSVDRTEEIGPALEAALAEAHPYELPEIVAVPLDAGLPGYLAWVAAESSRKLGRCTSSHSRLGHCR